jgi:hypothetical protein
LLEHRQNLVSEVRVVLSAYFQPHETAEVVTAQLAWWADEMQDWTREQVVWGLRKWNRDEPRRRPTPGDVLRILKRQRGINENKRHPKATPAEPERVRVSAERAQAMSDEVASTMRKFGAKDAN